MVILQFLHEPLDKELANDKEKETHAEEFDSQIQNGLTSMNSMLWCLRKSKTMKNEKEAANDERVAEVANRLMKMYGYYG